jgi:hypothetical protein
MAQSGNTVAASPIRPALAVLATAIRSAQ